MGYYRDQITPEAERYLKAFLQDPGYSWDGFVLGLIDNLPWGDLTEIQYLLNTYIGEMKGDISDE